MNTNKLLLVAVVVGALVASSTIAQASGVRTAAPRVRTSSMSTARFSANHWQNHNWGHHRHHSRVFFDVGFGYPFGYGYPYYDYYPYGYGYYDGPSDVAYAPGSADRSLVVQVQRRLANAGYYHGAIDGIMGNGTRSAIRSYERRHGLRVDGQLDPRLLATMGLA